MVRTLPLGGTDAGQIATITGRFVDALDDGDYGATVTDVDAAFAEERHGVPAFGTRTETGSGGE